MKKLLFAVFALLMCVATISCKNPTPVVEPLNFEACYTADYNEMLQAYPDSSFRFYYAQAKMNMNLDEITSIDSVSLDEVEVLFQAEENKIVKYLHMSDGTVTKDTIIGHWAECMDINPANVCMNLMQAVDYVLNTESHKPHSNIIVMRCPLYPPFNVHPYYIFGTILRHMSINSCDSEPNIDMAIEPTIEDTI